MKLRIVALVAMLMGCTVNFSPSVSKSEFDSTVAQLIQNDKILAEGLAKVGKTEVKK